MSVSQLPPASSVFVPLGETQSRSDLVVEAIKAAVISGRIKPGEMLIERRIAEELGVSKTPVREALIVLTRAGLLEVSRNRSTTVRRLSFTEVRYIYEQRSLSEPWAVGSAVAARRIRLDEAAAVLEEVEDLGRQGRRGEQAMANRRFHRALYEGCENTFVTATLDGLQDLTALAVTGVLWEKWPTWEDESREHRAIYEAAVQGDGERATALMRAHIEKSIVRVREQERA